MTTPDFSQSGQPAEGSLPAEAPKSTSGPTIVGIGASAGGLAALKTFFSHVPPESGMAFVVVVHLSPEHESHLPDLLQPHVSMPVMQVTQTLALEPNQVYVIPPGANLNTIDTHLRLSPLEEQRRERAPIDHFFRTLARTHNGHAIGVVLTGTGSDGALGIKEIKEQGGLTIVQDPNEAEYDGMPRSAIATGTVDLVLPLPEIPKAILRFAGTEPHVAVPEDGEETNGDARRFLQRVFAQLRSRTGRDFSRYKPSTILRRVARRMQFNHVEELSAYLNLLGERPDEVLALADDLLITVTRFFRDGEVFVGLEKVIPKLFEAKTSEEVVRVWTVGCATGEEAYSLAMLLLEEAARREAPPRFQVFASDLHDHSLATAREGFFPGDIEADVSPERLRQFFSRENGGYRIRKVVREAVVFASHNLLGDPPFSRMDLISCRNLLIYLQRDVQREVFDLFHYALNPDGFLVLGASETLDADELFRVVDKRSCIYRKRNVPGREVRLPVFPQIHLRSERERVELDGEPVSYGLLHERIVEQVAPPSMLVREDATVVHLSAHAGRYLVHPGGEITASALKLVREELRLELRAALHLVREQRQPVRTAPILVQFNGETHPVVLDVRPSLDPEGYVLVIFDESAAFEPPPALPPAAVGRGGADTWENVRLVAEEQLRATIEKYEVSQEELKASNEELQSANEELRSTMEELETSKEELQSINEELQTVNQENRHKVEELNQLSGDLQNLFASTEIATLFLDRKLSILRFTPKIGELFNVQGTDRGRPLSNFTHRLGYDELEQDAQGVLDSLVPVEREVQDEEGRWYLTRVHPYRSTSDRIEGVVITFVEITDRVRAEEALREAKNYAEVIIETLPEPLLILTPELLVKSANDVFYKYFQVLPDETVGRKIYDLGNGQWNIAALRTLLEDILPNNNVFDGYLVEHEFENLGRRVMLLNGRRLDHLQLILLGIADLTERQETLAALSESEEQFRQLNAVLDDRVREQTQELLQREERLQALAVMLTRAEQQERRRVANILHEHVQQLLVAARMFADRAKSETAEPEALALLEQTLSALRDATEACRSLSVDLSPPVLHSQGLVPAAHWLAERMQARYGLTVEVTADPAAEPEGAELRELLFHAISELLLNVVKHAQTNRASVRMECPDEQRIRIEVRDPGKGLEAHALEAAGLGGKSWGLFQIRERLEWIDGSFTIESAPYSGTCVMIVAPRAVAEERRELATEAESAGVSAAEFVDRQKNDSNAIQVVLIDDHEAIRSALAILIDQERDMKVIGEIGEGKLGVDIVCDLEPDVVIMDVDLPGISGVEATRQITTKHPGMRVIGLSMYDTADVAEQMRVAGAAAYLSKRAPAEELIAKIREMHNQG